VPGGGFDVGAASDEHRIYSCDDHLDIYNLPRDLWTSRLPRRLQRAAPHVEERGDARLWFAGDRLLGPSGRLPGFATALDRADVEVDGFRPSRPDLRMQDMERDGIYASIVYGPGTLFGFPIADPEVKRLTLRAWNDWAAEEFNAHLPERLSALAALPTSSPEEAVEELQRSVALGHRGAIFAAFEADVADPAWDRLWGAAAEAGIPISFHIGGGSQRLDAMKGGWQIAAFAAIAPIQLDEPFAIMMFSGALERNPGLSLVLAESGVGWIPYMVARMDATFEKHCVPHPGHSIKTRPSEIFRRQVYATFEEEPLGPQLIPLLSPDNFMWACDYPHPDSTWPDSRRAIAHALGALPPEAVRKVTGENCRRLYRLA
jgi:predicted TIM-barrel fold metal-dependent hydrolase